MAIIKGCHMVGSVPLADNEAVFKQCSKSLPHRLRRLPDGETGIRNYFTYFQAAVFKISPSLMSEFVMNEAVKQKSFTEAEINEGIRILEESDLETGYDTAAIDSFAVFKRLQSEGAIDKETKFQVSIPTPANVLGPFVQAAFQARVEPIYERALYRALRKIQDEIPHDKLAIQIDLAVDTMYWEGLEMYKPWFGGDVKQYMVDYIVRMVSQIDEDVDVGFHNCYGDMEHRHWLEPESLAVIVERGLQIFNQTPRPINFFHVPVPKSATDHLDAYLAPLQQILPKFKAHDTELSLGLVHYDDAETMHKMIDAASRIEGLESYSIASECGWGRTPASEIEGIMELTTKFSQPRW